MKRLHFKILSLLFVWALAGCAASGQSSPIQLYMAENSRLKKQIASLDKEMQNLRQLLEQEKKKNIELQATLNRVKPALDNHDREVGDLTAQIRGANQQLKQQQIVITLLGWFLMMAVLALLLYWQRYYLLKALRRLLDETGRPHKQQLQDNTIQPDEIAKRLYGSKR